MDWIRPIFDRTIQNVYNLDEKAFLNYYDFNRIQGNIEFLNNIIRDLKDTKISGFSEKVLGEIITQSDFDRIIEAINSLLDIVSRETVSIDIVDYQAINRIEKAINDLKEKLQIQRANILFCDNMALIDYVGV